MDSPGTWENLLSPAILLDGEVSEYQGIPEIFAKDIEESYEPIVPMKVANSLGGEPVEGRGEQDDASNNRNMSVLRNRIKACQRKLNE
jgi:hypothetical protein